MTTIDYRVKLLDILYVQYTANGGISYKTGIGNAKLFKQPHEKFPNTKLHHDCSDDESYDNYGCIERVKNIGERTGSVKYERIQRHPFPHHCKWNYMMQELIRLHFIDG